MTQPPEDRDDRMDEMLIQGARDYNQPGVVPREAMWARIAEARQTRVGRGRGGALGVSVLHRPWGHATGRSRLLVAGALAAGVILSIGIMTGRRLERSDAESKVLAAHVPTPDVSPKQDSGAADTSRLVAAADSAPKAATDSMVTRLRDQTRDTDRRVREMASSSAGPAEGNPSRGAPADDNLAYRLVVLQHLAGSEAMITTFRESAKRGAVDAQIASWSRELLSTTRMLESSAATQDPTMKRLLEDLDLVITQIVQYSTRGTHDPDELDLIEQSITKRGVITKLRTTLPARTPAAGT
jgi:hypothetical protein